MTPADSPPISRGVHVMQRAFPARDLLRPPAVWALFWSVLSSTAFAGILFFGLLMAHLMQTAGATPMAPAAANHVWGDTAAALYESLPKTTSTWTAFAIWLAVVVVCAVLWRIFTTQARLAAVKTGLDVSSRLRKSLHRQALRVGPGDLLQSERERVAALFTADADKVRAAVARRVFTYGIATTQILVLVGFAAMLDWRAALQSLVPLAGCWYLFARRREAWRTSRNQSRGQIEGDVDRLSEDFGKSRIICGYGMADIEHRGFQKRLDAYRGNMLKSVRRDELWHWLGWGLGIVAAMIALFFIGIKTLQPPTASGALAFASAIMLLASLCLLYGPLAMFSGAAKDWSAAAPSADRIYKYLDRIPDVSQAVGAKFLQPLSSSVQYESVSYDTPEGPVLKGIDLRLRAGQAYAFVATNPLEAQALAYMLPRFIEPKTGRVRIDGEDIAWVTLESLRAETAYVGGEAPWFSGTVIENIRSGDERRNVQDVTEAAKTAHAHKFITRLPRGYETDLGDVSVRLSVGDAFRLALARAVMQDPALLIIEEPTEPLDADTKALLDDAFQRICRNRTVIFLPARLPTVRRCDGIVLLHEGVVAAAGKHAELVKSSEIYRHWDYTSFHRFRNSSNSK